MENSFETAVDAIRFITGGKALFTMQSEKTGAHFTFKVSQKDDDGTASPFFVNVLSGTDNTDWQAFTFIGHIKADGQSCLIAGRKGKPDAASFKAFSWAWAHLNRGSIPEGLSIAHEGRCCRCNRVLTHPESISSGIGPECAKKGA